MRPLPTAKACELGQTQANIAKLRTRGAKPTIFRKYLCKVKKPSIGAMKILLKGIQSTPAVAYYKESKYVINNVTMGNISTRSGILIKRKNIKMVSRKPQERIRKRETEDS